MRELDKAPGSLDVDHESWMPAKHPLRLLSASLLEWFYSVQSKRQSMRRVSVDGCARPMLGIGGDDC